MKSAVAITLILGGIFVVALPPLSDAWHFYMFNKMLERQASFPSITLPAAMDDTYRFGCWIMGVLMILIAVAASIVPARLQLRTPSAQPESPRHGSIK
jgi:hypothetical protein